MPFPRSRRERGPGDDDQQGTSECYPKGEEVRGEDFSRWERRLGGDDFR